VLNKKVPNLIIYIILVSLVSLFLSSCSPKYDLTVQANPVNSGTVTPNSGTFDSGVAITLNAQPASGYRFDYWSGDATGTSNPLNTTIDSAKNIIANFKAQYTINVSVSPESGGTVTPMSGKYDDGESVQLSAKPATGYRFSYWSGDATGTANDITVLMNNNKTITANFIRLLTFGVIGNGQDIWVNFPDLVEGYYVSFYLAFGAPHNFTGFSEEVKHSENGKLIWHLQYIFDNITRRDGDVDYFDWEVIIYSTTSEETWHHVGRFYNIIYDGNHIVSFKAVIDGKNYSYP
jgi:hypothetical protein